MTRSDDGLLFLDVLRVSTLRVSIAFMNLGDYSVIGCYSSGA